MNLKNFNSMKEIVEYKKNLKLANNYMKDINKDIYTDILSINNLINDIYNFEITNKEILEKILEIINKRPIVDTEGKYKLHVINSAKIEKYYKYDDFNQVQLKEKITNTCSSIVLANDKVNLSKLSVNNTKELLINIENIYNEYGIRSIIVYDYSSDFINQEDYLNNLTTLKKIYKSNIELFNREQEELSEFVFNKYKEANMTNNKKRKLEIN